MKTITINGVEIEATKDDLVKALKDFDKPVGTIREHRFFSDIFKKEISNYFLVKNDNDVCSLGSTSVDFQENYSQLIYKIANAMGALASKNDILGENVMLYNIHFDKKNNVFDGDIVEDYIGGTILLSQAIVKESDIADLLNNSPLMEEFK